MKQTFVIQNLKGKVPKLIFFYKNSFGESKSVPTEQGESMTKSSKVANSNFAVPRLCPLMYQIILIK